MNLRDTSGFVVIVKEMDVLVGIVERVQVSGMNRSCLLSVPLANQVVLGVVACVLDGRTPWSCR